jgi:hypothetical protein
MLAVLANMLYVYASLPEQVIVIEQGDESLQVGREPLFYGAMILIALVNVLVYLFSKSITPDENFRTWLNGLVITLNIFLIIAMSYLNLYNSVEQFDFSRIGFIIYSSVGLVLLWAISWPLYVLTRKFISKEVV